MRQKERENPPMVSICTTPDHCCSFRSPTTKTHAPHRHRYPIDCALATAFVRTYTQALCRFFLSLSPLSRPAVQERDATGRDLPVLILDIRNCHEMTVVTMIIWQMMNTSGLPNIHILVNFNLFVTRKGDGFSGNPTRTMTRA